ncbi:MAG: hypothetical protein M3R21_08945 [Candidatus Dormibacteraeota bacterium]|nr:hypothetical protein [Candidatus Dormibacteraeota bacterium]
MHARVFSATVESAAAQQKDNLCAPFWASRVLIESGFSTWDGQPIDEDLVALRAGTVLPEAHSVTDVPAGAQSRTSYRFELPVAPVQQSGTSPSALAAVIEAASGGELVCVQLRGAWNAERVERLVDEMRDLGARLIANIRTGRLWGSHPSVDVLLAELEGRRVEDPRADWDVGHFVELELLLRGPRRSLVVIHDSYPSLGQDGRHLQPPRALAAALLRGDGREGGVLAVVPKARAEAAKTLAAEIGLEIGTWNNGTRS